jgi:hypothetical protein
MYLQTIPLTLIYPYRTRGIQRPLNREMPLPPQEVSPASISGIKDLYTEIASNAVLLPIVMTVQKIYTTLTETS